MSAAVVHTLDLSKGQRPNELTTVVLLNHRPKPTQNCVPESFAREEHSRSSREWRLIPATVRGISREELLERASSDLSLVPVVVVLGKSLPDMVVKLKNVVHDVSQFQVALLVVVEEILKVLRLPPNILAVAIPFSWLNVEIQKREHELNVSNLYCAGVIFPVDDLVRVLGLGTILSLTKFTRDGSSRSSIKQS